MNNNIIHPFTDAKSIMDAVNEGNTVYYASISYTVTKDNRGEYYINCGGHQIGLTWADGKTLNGKASDFFIINNTKN